MFFTEDINELRLILTYSLHQACWKYCDHNFLFASVFNKAGQLSAISWSSIFYKVVHDVMVPIRECLWWFHMLDSPPVPYSFSSSISDHLSDWEDCLIAELLLGTVFSVNSHGFYCHRAHSEVSLSESNLKNFKVIVRQVQSHYEIIFFLMLLTTLKVEILVGFFRAHHTFPILTITSFSRDLMLLPRYVKQSTHSSGSLDVVSMLPLQLHYMNLFFFPLAYRPILDALLLGCVKN